MATLKTFNHEPINLQELLTETIDNKRYYVTPKGAKLPSVTSILSQRYGGWVHEWRKKVGEEQANKISAQASRRGTAIHKLCEDYLNNTPDFMKKAMPSNIEMFMTMVPVLNRINNIYALEKPVYSESIGAAGRVDCIAQFDGYPSIIDYKTSKRVKDESEIESYFVQATLYSLLFEDMTTFKCKQLVVIMGVDHSDPSVFVKDRADYVALAAEVMNSFQKKK